MRRKGTPVASLSGPRRSQVLRFARNDEWAFLLRQINPTGKSSKFLSSPSRKNIPLNLSGKSVI
jgi:hypothetical protein